MNRAFASIAVIGIYTVFVVLPISTRAQTAPILIAEQMSAKDFNNRGVDKLETKDYKGAIADFNQALRLDPKNAKAYFNRGFAYSSLENYQNAIEDYTKAIQMKPGDAEAFYNRGLAYSNLDNNKAAIAYFSKSAQLDRQ
ncbi:tetratricopeptide repeat protein [Microcoleus sp. FACHB-831]|uniref:tetratricopeptide repeat protein n=1 Tax=Microcoleus sp. FACHB-831 TaxID=2692827 RepID=UPI001688B38D|nr:tetratricopeptide repeat protein [Microcoleus sp. FACHB-831]MBD1924413.1 tetratricopeptide repeat protein [Microcoleus sp. FACHB-831]